MCLGATAALSVLGRRVAVERERGERITRADGSLVLVTYHPAAILRAAETERSRLQAAFVQDLRAAAAHARECDGPSSRAES